MTSYAPLRKQALERDYPEDSVGRTRVKACIAAQAMLVGRGIHDGGDVQSGDALSDAMDTLRLTHTPARAGRDEKVKFLGGTYYQVAREATAGSVTLPTVLRKLFPLRPLVDDAKVYA